MKNELKKPGTILCYSVTDQTYESKSLITFKKAKEEAWDKFYF